MKYMMSMEDFDMQAGGFTDKARTALSLAERVAGRMRIGYVGTEHILIGLIRRIQVLRPGFCLKTAWTRIVSWI